MTKQHNWDLYFMRVAREVSKKSKCMSRKLGAVLVKDKAIISTGFNGAPRGVKECNERDYLFYENLGERTARVIKSNCDITKCPRRICGFKSGEGLFMCQAGHAERNALIQAGRNGISTKDTVLYCYCGQVCKDCAIETINAGVKELIYLDGQREYDKYGGILLKEAEIIVRKIKPEEL